MADDEATICKGCDVRHSGDRRGEWTSVRRSSGVHRRADLRVVRSGLHRRDPFRSNTTDDLDGDAKTVEVLLQNDDVPGVRITPAYGVLHVDESGAPVDVHCYWLNLTSAPTAEVTITVDATDPQIEATPTVITLDAGDWNILDWHFTTNQVCVRAVDDSHVGRDRPLLRTAQCPNSGRRRHQRHSVRRPSGAPAPRRLQRRPALRRVDRHDDASPDFDADAQTLDVLISDDDVAGVTFTPATLNLVEGTESSYSAV
ncbi:MAG: hypothetical protein R2854_15355 [Caldilineaceae bacterium]